MSDKDFGWINYKNLGWINEEKLKYYEGRFKLDNDPHEYTLITIRFWSNHPILAMRYIYEKCNTIEDVKSFNYKDIIL